jgi:hypothetical protein
LNKKSQGNKGQTILQREKEKKRERETERKKREKEGKEGRKNIGNHDKGSG